MTSFTKICQLMLVLSGVALAAIMGVTIADILMKDIFYQPITSAFEIVQNLLVVVIFFSFPEIFRRGGNIVVDLVDHLVSARAVAVLKLVGIFSTLVFLIVLLVAMINPALDTVRSIEFMQESGVPTFALWIPIFLGTIVTLLAVLSELRSTLGGR